MKNTTQYDGEKWTVEVNNNENEGEVSSTGNYIGGIIGSAIGSGSSAYFSSYKHAITISNCKNTGKVLGEDYTAGVVGYCGNYVTEISACINNADITGNNYVGGYAGYTTTGTLIKIA